MINTRAVIRITLPHTQSPVGLGRSSSDVFCDGFGVDSGLGWRLGFVTALGSDLDKGLGFCFAAGLGCDEGFGFGSSLGLSSTVGSGEDAGLGSEDVSNGRNASQDLVSGLTCIPYLTPACFALVQLKNLSPLLGLKFWQLPHILLFMSREAFGLYSDSVRRSLCYVYFVEPSGSGRRT